MFYNQLRKKLIILPINFIFKTRTISGETEDDQLHSKDSTTLKIAKKLVERLQVSLKN